MVLLALAGVFRAKVPTDKGSSAPRAATDLPLSEVRLVRRPRHESAVSTVRPVHEAAIASKLLAKVVDVKVKAGQAVVRIEVLVKLDDADLAARLKQAEASLLAAKSAHEQGAADFQRARRLLQSNAIARADFDKFQTTFRTTQAELDRGQEAVREAGVLLDHATIRAPIGGIVIDRWWTAPCDGNPFNSVARSTRTTKCSPAWRQVKRSWSVRVPIRVGSVVNVTRCRKYGTSHAMRIGR
jgi:membrane fusion protein (multidrug efflux system)